MLTWSCLLLISDENWRGGGGMAVTVPLSDICVRVLEKWPAGYSYLHSNLPLVGRFAFTQGCSYVRERSSDHNPAALSSDLYPVEATNIRAICTLSTLVKSHNKF